MAIATAKAYNDLREFEFAENTLAAIDDALQAMKTDVEREIVRKSLFEGIPLAHINLPYSEVQMKRIRRKFIVELAKRLQ